MQDVDVLNVGARDCVGQARLGLGSEDVVEAGQVLAFVAEEVEGQRALLVVVDEQDAAADAREGEAFRTT